MDPGLWPSTASLLIMARRARRADAPIARGRSRRPGARTSGSSHCSARPMRWRASSARCSAIFGASKSSAICRTEQLRQIEADAQKVGRELGNTGNQIAELEEETEAARPILEARMVELYKLGSAGYVRLLFNVSDLKEVGRAYRMVAAVAAIDRHRAEQHQAESRPPARGAWLARSAAGRDGQAAGRPRPPRASPPNARRTRARSSSLEIDRRRDLTAELAGELQGAQLKLQQTLAAMNSGTPRAAAEGSALPIRPFRGDLDWPVAGRMLTPFGQARRRRVARAGADGRAVRGRGRIARPRGARRNRRVCRAFHRLRQSRHRRSRRADILVIRTAGRAAGRARRESRARTRPWAPQAASWPEFRGCISRCASTASRSIR